MMLDNVEMNYERLLKNVISVVKEWHVKLGYRKERIRLYYKKSSLMAMLKVSEAELYTQLIKFSEYAEKWIGKTEIQNTDAETVCFLLSETAGEYVNENTPSSGFIYDFIAEISKHGSTISSVTDVFYKYSDKVAAKDWPEPDFDKVIYFEDSSIDEFIYCLKEEGGHIIYHRFTKEDFEDMFGEI